MVSEIILLVKIATQMHKMCAG